MVSKAINGMPDWMINVVGSTIGLIVGMGLYYAIMAIFPIYWIKIGCAFVTVMVIGNLRDNR